ncbi:hypothetical protein F4815DRAFT_489581 [Daldinia loculata]|nr:hypothetical protein F4815DRAFT_489581 [Daldinia loculata]
MANSLSLLESLGRNINQQPTSLLLNQPLDILIELHDYLSPEASVALALSCKSAYLTYLFNVKKLDRQDLENLQILLEGES